MKNIKAGSIQELLPIAIPIVFSQAVDMAMIFCDRFFLAQLGKEELAATLSGGVLNYMVCTLLYGTLGQITSLVAQYRSANEMEKGIKTIHQALLLCLFLTPIFYLVGIFFAPTLLSLFNHEQRLLDRELTYFNILSLTVITTSFRIIFANFYIGIGKTKIVSLASFVGVIINIPLTYVLVFGELGFPKLGIAGAALGTVISSLIPIIILLINFYSRYMRVNYQTSISFRFDFELLSRLVRYGFPSGFEMLVNVSGFFFFTMTLYSYSGVVAAATTIVLNWDMVCFIPMLGISQAVGGQVGKYLGEKRKDLALSSAWSALQLGWIYSISITFVYFTLNEFLVTVFDIPEVESKKELLYYGTTLLKISCLYFFFDVNYSILGGILKGSGDTVWPMLTSNTIMWTMATLVYTFKSKLQMTPIQAWFCLTAMVTALGIIYMIRFLRKKWLNRLMIEN
jgi:multidrug resistance protein, MATE family